MKFTLKNYQTLLTPELKKKAAKNTVRECDEVSKGLFQAYLDEKEQTFDTELAFNSKGEIIANSCDCAATTAFCSHQAALLLYLINGQKKVSTLKINKKTDTLESLVYDADPDKVKAWLLALFSKNKDLGLAFTHEFSNKLTPYSVEELKKLSLESVKAVVNNRKIIEIAEVKKIVELWKTLHDPVIDDYLLQMGNVETFLRLDAIVTFVDEIQYRLRTSSSRIDTYRDGILLKILPSLDQVQKEEYWDQVVQLFVDRIHIDNQNIRIHYLSFLVQLFERSNVARKRKLAIDLVTQYMSMGGEKFYHKDNYIAAVFQMIVAAELFETYVLMFKPLRYQNTYNCLLIKLLIKNGQLAIAEQYCLEQIAGNSVSDYNKPYFEFLTEIYTSWEDEEKLVQVLKETLNWSLDFSTYLVVSRHTPAGEEKRKWRTNLQARARRLASDSLEAVTFWFQMLEEEGRYEKMIDYLNDTVNYELMERYAERMLVSNKVRFLKAVLSRSDHRMDKKNHADLLPLLDKLFRVMRKHYSADEMLKAVKTAESFHFRNSNHLVPFMKAQLIV